MVEADRQTVKLVIRLDGPVLRALDTVIAQYGGYSALGLEALDQVDLRRSALVPTGIEARRVITISLPRAVHKTLRQLASERGTTAGVLMNTALAKWLENRDIPA
jgi:hypothetical protein